MAGLELGVDIGGTFTDLVLVAGGAGVVAARRSVRSTRWRRTCATDWCRPKDALRNYGVRGDPETLEARRKG